MANKSKRKREARKRKARKRKKKPKAHYSRCSRREPYKVFRWFGPAYAIYKVVRDHWPW
jgi:hypothetical protein